MDVLVKPWLTKANGWPSNHYGSTADGSDWELDWENTEEEYLLRNAPFKLTAIVNRMDIRGNAAYARTLNNAGEIRFIFTLIAPYDIVTSTSTTPAGHPPQGFDGAGVGTYECMNPIDWQGMNVIIEYGIPISNLCELRDYAQGWLDLSDEYISDYNQALEELTHYVIDAGAAPGRVDNNKSALNQIRTNERIFTHSDCANNSTSANLWKKSDWELSQFEIDATSHSLKGAPVTNTPMNVSNTHTTLIKYSSSNTFGTPSSFQVEADPLIEWVFANGQEVKKGNHSMPASFSYGGDQFKLAATAIMDLEHVHFWDLNWACTTATNYTYIPITSTSDHSYARSLRHQVSLNTCQGCHGGETKTTFTMVRPVPYGESVNYWGNVPCTSSASTSCTDHDFMVDERLLDTRPGIPSRNIGTSYFNGGTTPDPNHPMGLGTAPTTLGYFPRVSPFITGRNYSGSGTYEDDNHDAGDDPQDNKIEDLTDPTIKHIFYVFDPANLHNGTVDETYPLPQLMHQYNDLDMRKQRLCQFVNTPCNSREMIASIIKQTSATLPPIKGH